MEESRLQQQPTFEKPTIKSKKRLKRMKGAEKEIKKMMKVAKASTSGNKCVHKNKPSNDTETDSLLFFFFSFFY